MCAEIPTDDQLSLVHWECNNRLLTKTNHSLLSVTGVIITLDKKNHVTVNWYSAGRIQGDGAGNNVSFTDVRTGTGTEIDRAN